MPTIRIAKIPYLSLKRCKGGLRTEATASFNYSHYGDASYNRLYALLRKNRIQETGPTEGEAI
jgi:hypothetical protein